MNRSRYFNFFRLTLIRERDVDTQEVEKLLSQLEREGTIYRPREDYLKKT
jgi:hypothetical protein